MNSSSFISHSLIVSEIAKKSGDKEFRFDSEGYYMSLVQEALQELSFDTFFLESEKIFEIKDCLKFDLPSGFFNIRQIYLFSGPECDPTTATKVWWKRNFKNGISSDNWGNSGDPFYKNRSGSNVPGNSGFTGNSNFTNNPDVAGRSNPPGNLFFCGISNGVIELSKNCKVFEKLSIRANGLITDIGDVPIIPIFFRQAVVDYGIVEALSIRMAENPSDAAINVWQNILNRYNRRLTLQYEGSWEKARFRAKNIDSKIREDLHEYFAKLDT